MKFCDVVEGAAYFSLGLVLGVGVGMLIKPGADERDEMSIRVNIDGRIVAREVYPLPLRVGVR